MLCDINTHRHTNKQRQRDRHRQRQTERQTLQKAGIISITHHLRSRIHSAQTDTYLQVEEEVAQEEEHAVSQVAQHSVSSLLLALRAAPLPAPPAAASPPPRPVEAALDQLAALQVEPLEGVHDEAHLCGGGSVSQSDSQRVSQWINPSVSE
jgi:hypothetical protein